jgi:hypothetical protein
MEVFHGERLAVRVDHCELQAVTRRVVGTEDSLAVCPVLGPGAHHGIGTKEWSDAGVVWRRQEQPT